MTFLNQHGNIEPAGLLPWQGWLLLPWQRAQTVGRVGGSPSTGVCFLTESKPGSMEAQTEFSPQGFSCTMLLKPQELPKLNIVEDVYS